MNFKEIFEHRLRDIDSVLRSNEKTKLLKHILFRTVYKILKKDEKLLRKKIPSSFSRLNSFNFYSRPETLDFLFYSKYYEPETTKYLLKKSGDFFLDIGSHIGRFAVLGSKNFKKIIAFEANPKNYDSLIKNLKLNEIKNVDAVNFAVSNKEKELFLEMPELNTGATKISENGTIKTKSIVLDKFLKKEKINPKDVKIVLIDVEGHEEEVLKGATKFLKETNSELIIECFNLPKIEETLDKFGYKKIKCFDFYNYLFIKEK